MRILAALLFSLVTVASASAETITVPGHRTVIEAPAGFSPADDFAGAESDGGASITVVEFPGAAFAQLKAGLRPETFAANPRAKMSDVKVLPLARKDEYLAFEGTAVVEGVPFRRVVLVFHDAETTAFVTVNIPDALLRSGTITREAMLATLNHTGLGTRTPASPSFVFEAPGSFKPAGTVMNVLTMYNRAGKMPEERVATPAASIGVTKAPDLVVSGDPRTQGEAFFRHTHRSSNVGDVKIETVEIDGLKGFSYEAKSADGSPPEAYYSVYLIDGGHFLWLAGTAPADEAEATIPEFKTIFASFRLSPKR